MNTPPSLRLPAALCLVAAPLLLAAGDALGLPRAYAGIGASLVMELAFVLFVPAVFALAHLVRHRAPTFGLAAGAVAMVGAVVGAGIQVYYRAGLALAQASSDPIVGAAAEQALEQGSLAFLTSVVPGILFPIGLLLLASGLARGRRFPMGAAALLAVGAVLFPVGRIGGFVAAIVGSDLALLAALAWVASVLWTRAEVWEGGAVEPATLASASVRPVPAS